MRDNSTRDWWERIRALSAVAIAKTRPSRRYLKRPAVLSWDYHTVQVNGFLYDICRPQSSVVQENKVMGYSNIMMCQFYYFKKQQANRFSSLNRTKSKVFGFPNTVKSNLIYLRTLCFGPKAFFPVPKGQISKWDHKMVTGEWQNVWFKARKWNFCRSKVSITNAARSRNFLQGFR